MRPPSLSHPWDVQCNSILACCLTQEHCTLPEYSVVCSLLDDFSFSHAVVTGASEGIGRGYALEVHNHDIVLIVPLHEIR